MEFTGTVQFPHDLDRLTLFRRTVHAALDALGVDSQIRDDTELMVGEICVAVLTRCRLGGRYRVDVRVDERECAVEATQLPAGGAAPTSWSAEEFGVAATLAHTVELAADQPDGARARLVKPLTNGAADRRHEPNEGP